MKKGPNYNMAGLQTLQTFYLLKFWGIMNNYLYDFTPQPTNQKELEDAFLVIWDKIDQEKINKLIRSFQNRLDMCLEINGGSISHLLSSGQKRIKKTDQIDNESIQYLLANNDNVIRYMQNKEMHHKWTRISANFKYIQHLLNTVLESSKENKRF